MTRVREETQTRGTREGSLVALAATGGVITSAGLVLAATFLVLGTMPLVAFVEIGVAVALGVLLDTLIVRSVLVTALNLDLGGRIWWPSSSTAATGRGQAEPPANRRREGLSPGGRLQPEGRGGQASSRARTAARTGGRLVELAHQRRRPGPVA